MRLHSSSTISSQNLSAVYPPTVKVHPADQLMLVRSSANFTVSVEDIPGHDHTYQWQKNNINIVGATSDAHTITCVVKTDEGTYCCVVSNAAGTMTSDRAQLTVCKSVPVYSLVGILSFHISPFYFLSQSLCSKPSHHYKSSHKSANASTTKLS